ncbi:hypothetical protein JCM21142_104383 [Saccharicrinis fermentans DSM 9555 = JCM 21142]|uniref:Uncharacterized protein n=1 Tax=Saccharicrinis fermentans DSM 9555 = JCM 21142 TaxID=869213 RepID=W7Y450_9BACT|nr:hypothetical protein JCM21142_104383 [Saccharicrinis fermentans DSM 9555 = JCM 21142]
MVLSLYLSLSNFSQYPLGKFIWFLVLFVCPFNFTEIMFINIKKAKSANKIIVETSVFSVFDKKASKTRLSIFLKPRSLLMVNDCFKNENNAIFGVFLQRLFNS